MHINSEHEPKIENPSIENQPVEMNQLANNREEIPQLTRDMYINALLYNFIVQGRGLRYPNDNNLEEPTENTNFIEPEPRETINVELIRELTADIVVFDEAFDVRTHTNEVSTHTNGVNSRMDEVD